MPTMPSTDNHLNFKILRDFFNLLFSSQIYTLFEITNRRLLQIHQQFWKFLLAISVCHILHLPLANVIWYHSAELKWIKYVCLFYQFRERYFEYLMKFNPTQNWFLLIWWPWVKVLTFDVIFSTVSSFKGHFYWK